MISIFKEMGFSHDRALRLLRQHDNNFYEAVDSLVSPESSEASPDSRSTFLHLSQDSALEGFSGGSTGSGGNCIACGVPFEKSQELRRSQMCLSCLQKTDRNEAWCDVCLGTDGDQLCCDGCTKSFHLMCLNPPAQEAPLGEWFCAQCACKRRRLDAGAEIDVEIEKEAPFPRTLIKHMQATNPENFCLPFRFFFDGSSTPLIIVEEEKGEHSLPPPLAEPSPNSRVGIVYGCRECSDGKIQNPTNICACNFCYEPYSTYEAEKLLQIRVQEEQLQVLVKWKDLPWSELSWTDAVNVPDRLLAQFMLSEPFKSMVHHVRPRLSCVETETQVLPQHGRKCHYKFINGVSFGVWQLLDLFSREELCHFEREICEMERLRHQGFFKDNTIDCTKGGRRTKYFLG